MPETPSTPGPSHTRFEILPLGRSEEQAQSLPEPVRLTVTCSPKHGPDRSVEVAGRLRAMGHAVTVHIAARMVRDRDHLDVLLSDMAAAGADELFLIAGDADAPEGEFSSAVALAPIVAQHPKRPTRVGIPGYPEGHPKISDEALQQALVDRSAHADYVATQMCFDPEALSARIGVGPSLDFLRKQRGLRGLLSRGSTSDTLYDALAPALGDPRLGLAGFHIFTFNQLTETFAWERAKEGTNPRRSARSSVPRLYVQAEKRSQ
jgi:methylenetetrahydrofolate reductase (NADPH)